MVKTRKHRPSTVFISGTTCTTTQSSTATSSSRGSNNNQGLAPYLDPPPIKALLNEDSIRAHLSDYYDDFNSNVDSKMVDVWESFYEKYHTPQYTMIRPSGNPCPIKGFIDMFCSEDIKLLGFSLISVDTVRILCNGKAAVATYTVDQRFLYKGISNEDRAVYTCVLEEKDGDIKTAFEQRTTGQPIPKETRWET